MNDVKEANALKILEHRKEVARIGKAAKEFFKDTPQGKELYAKLKEQSGDNHSAFSARDNFNPNAAAFRDGMRATFLIISNIIQEYENERNTET